MKHKLTGAALVAALGFTAVSAHAGCADPRIVTHQAGVNLVPLGLQSAKPTSSSIKSSAGGSIVGTWRVSYTSAGAPFADAFIQWHSDGTEWENIDLPILGGNLCLGSWKSVDSTHASRFHVGWSYTDGTLSGYFTESEIDELSNDGNGYHGVNDTKIYDLQGNMLAEVPGTAVALRIQAP